MKPRSIRDESVTKFLNTIGVDQLFIPAIVIAELYWGFERLPPGRRRSNLEADFGTFLSNGFSGRIVQFDANSAKRYAEARFARQTAGRPISAQDALIGGMALAYGATLATRNIPDFEGYGLTLINPWDAAKNVE